MVARVNNLPSDYVPYAALGVCSNMMISGTAPFIIKDVVPLLVGKDSHPKIWLSAPADASGNTWVDLIEAGQSRHKDVKVFVSEEETETLVQFRELAILTVKSLTPTNAAILRLDLRPVGINVFGDETTLNLGGNRFSGNTFNRVGYMIRLV